ncbi:MAG: restriction endonuclease subunit S [Gammaproteobacteria bacterium]|nr:restriction endonuclease subunit S [Gammaproteobacteria bacterium]
MQQLLTGRMRFPEFGESAADKGELPKEWKIKSLDLFGSFLRGKGISNSEKTETGIPCITYGEIYTRHEFVIKNFYSFIDNSTARKSQRIKRNDILFAGSGETLDEIGRCVAHTKDIEAYAGGDIVIFRPKGVNPLYLSYSLNSELLIRQKRKLGQGHSVVHIYSAVLKTLQVPLPSFEEQHCVATILSSCGQEIDLLFGKEIAFREQKKGLMQKLLTGEVRAQVMGDGSYD